MSSPNNGSAVRQRFKPPDPASKANKVSTKPPQRQPPKTPFKVEPILAFYILLAGHTIAALYSPIQDCDEVFNYWEPTHYLTHGYGFETWEYSPDYAIRSWAYTGLHALVTLPAKLLGASKTTEFYGLRIFLGVICALCETRLFAKISATFNPRVATMFLAVLATSPGMSHASIAYLPSSFAMYFTALGMASFLDWRGGLRTAQGIWMFGIGACLGWPFAAAMVAPFVLEEIFLASISDKDGVIETAWRIVDGMTRTLITLMAQVCVDWFFYKKLVIVPLNIVLYNVFSGKGPALYGTEPWHFYIRNLFLNFHVWLPLALLSMPLLLAQHFLRAKGATKASYLRGIVFLTPFYLWLAIFTLQPHKEERFMYPAYPALALNAAMSLHIILANLGSTDPKNAISKIPVQLRYAAVVIFMTAALGLSLLRTLGTMTAYGAPLSIYASLHNPNTSSTSGSDSIVCLGKEWYRFPSHYLLPPDHRAKFIRSEFSGLLPGEFSDIPASQGFGSFPGTWLVPAGMNDANREDAGKYTELKRCDYVVDWRGPSTETTSLEPSFVEDEATWEKVACEKFLDAAATGVLGRMLWVPDVPGLVPSNMKRVWGEYCLLKRKRHGRVVQEKPAKTLDWVQKIENIA
ncbi:mannosyltransferase [Friedmanniomyces endolithicus]|nr:mannosyltransferase [Friedmanniomyces endolithicus]